MINKKLASLLSRLHADEEKVERNFRQEKSAREAQDNEITPEEPDKVGRRSFMQKAGLGGLSLAGLMHASLEDQLAYGAQKVNRYSSPTELKITDLRIAQVGNVPLLRIDTNQGIYGLGDVRDGGDKRYALFLKSRLLGENPCNIERLFRKVKQFGHHGRQGGGVSGVEMALWDLTGKAYGVPVYQMLGGKYRNKVRLYADTPRVKDPEEFARRMKERADQGFTFLKMDVNINMIKDIPGTITNAGPYGNLRDWDADFDSYGRTMHPFTGVQITEKGIAEMEKYLAAVRGKIGYEIPLAVDHLGHMGINSNIALGRAFQKYNLAWLEDMVPWEYTSMWKEISQAIDVPTLTGEDIYLKEGFKDLIEQRAVDIVHPDPGSAGGILETKKIGDYAQEYGIAMAVHHAASPISFMATVHAIAATQNFMALEHHSVDEPWWEDLVKGIEKPIVKDGYVTVPEKPGIGVELNEAVVKKHLKKGEGYFEPTKEWDELRSWDRIWS
jgi:L-alanine-DL-glutamate epimerase-like enolase superfamily enzyme